jgi:transcriptional regulator with XRE-family HTH domain
LEEFCKRLRVLRERRGLTARTVAKKAGIPETTYREWEYGRKIQGEEVYLRLSEALEVSLSELMTGKAQSTGEILKAVQSAESALGEVKKLLLRLS